MVACDLNGDGKPDLIALASGMTDLVWFENPGWQRHVIARNLPHMINLAAWDWDGDGVPEIALAYEFSMQAAKSIGIVAMLHHVGDPREPWLIREIDRLPTSHRLRWANIDGSAKKVVVNAPLTGADAVGPDYRTRVPLVYYEPGDWKRRMISDENEGVQHGITIFDWDGDGRDEILTASFLGIHLYKLGANRQWTRTEITRGDPAPWPKNGTSDVAIGHSDGQRFIAAIEPWHGNQVAVYFKNGSAWNREVIDDSSLDGHTIAAADLDGDGNDEIVAGFRGKPPGVRVYRIGFQKRTQRIVVDPEITAASCAVADLNGDGKPDLACIGSATHNLKWYENVTQ